jgi:hypothetical protein
MSSVLVQSLRLARAVAAQRKLQQTLLLHVTLTETDLNPHLIILGTKINR